MYFQRSKPVASLSSLVSNACKPLPAIDANSFGSYFDRFGTSRVVLIGDASHGTSDFYRARANITKRLITHHNFNIVAIEGDWPDCHALDKHVRGHDESTPSSLFPHFPRWMWRNREMQSFVDWLRVHNSNVPPQSRAGVYGLDLYSMASSIQSTLKYLDKADTDLSKLARKRYACLDPWIDDPAQYGRAALHRGHAPCEDAVEKVLQDLLENRTSLEPQTQDGDGDSFFDAEMNARLVCDAERYYRSMYWADSASWNLRDTHMFETLRRLLEVKGGKAVVWAHNSHVGDARATGMKHRKEINLGQLCRQHFVSEPNEVAIIGMGTHYGTVAAADNWHDDMRLMAVNPSRKDSWERVMHDTGIESFLLDLRRGVQNEDILEALQEEKLERFIGVIYRPATEKWSHYVNSSLAKQFDAFVWFDKTSAVEAFEVQQPEEAVARGDTYPFGL